MRAVLFLLTCWCSMLQAQRIDSVHVYAALEPGPYSSASANALTWRLHQAHAPHTILKGTEITTVRKAMELYTEVPHYSGSLPGLKHVAMVFTHGRPTAMGVTEDLDRFINFTARTEYRIDSFTGHLQVRAMLLELLMDH
ncbi:MAG: hypothetical protein IPH05_13185 [Flavobacteriales bacterium]|jgi:hypothetical protein|nr:hypothetical protein [Flavobacteriales bacterium]MBK6549546.1 hypothetical protein [Flavobacteriales bacterium]MBK6883866.1 hypothetical protein [Flavobacteriales bacterium]MBK7100258.1 hypothetical protein [Flavobacteriales bacterium]MBK7110951.1 hypothetical protein [Flavobacteriales bacterium]